MSSADLGLFSCLTVNPSLPKDSTGVISDRLELPLLSGPIMEEGILVTTGRWSWFLRAFIMGQGLRTPTAKLITDFPAYNDTGSSETVRRLMVTVTLFKIHN